MFSFYQHNVVKQMHVGQKIKKLLEERPGLKKADFAMKIGHTEQSLYSILNKEDINTSLLKTICEELNITLSQFFTKSDDKANKTNVVLQ